MKRNKIYQPDEDHNYWRDVYGFEGRYQVSRLGTIRRIFKSGVRDLAPFHKCIGGHGRLFVKLIDKDGNGKLMSVQGIVARAWLGPMPDGMVPHHKNGIKTDNRADNIAYITKSELGKKTGAASRRKTVFKINPVGEIVETYQSARAAARANYCSHQAIIDRCNNRVQNPFNMDGYNYQYDFTGD